MSLLFIESFDGIAAAQVTRKFDNATSVAFNTTSGRRGTLGLQLGSTTVLGKNLGADYTTAVIAGFALFTDGSLPSSGTVMTFQEGSTVHVAICVTSAGRLQARLANSSGAIIAESGVGVIPASGNNYIEAKVVVHDSTGSVVLRVNGVQVASASNVDTRNGGTSGVCNRVQLQGAGNPTVYGADDWYVCDTNGSSNNDFLGDVRVDFLAVNAAGNYAEFTPSAGSNFQNVDEAPTADDDTSYNESDVDNERDSYQHASLASLVVEQIKGVQVFVVAKKSDAGSRSLKVGIRSGTTDNVDSGTALGTAYTGYRRIFDTDPNTAAAWTKANVDAVESMVQVGAP